MRTIEDLRIKQAYPLNIKVEMSKARVREWVHEFGEDGVYISFSGGKDSTVLLDIVRSVYPNIEAVFVNTGLEFPEIQQFVKSFDNVTILRPTMRFDEVIIKYGYPMISKEISEVVWESRKALKSEKVGKYATTRLQKLNGELKDKDGNKSAYNCEKYKPLLYTDFDISHKCCAVMKKDPMRKYGKQTGKVAITGQLASESRLRTKTWLTHGCNAFESKNPTSNPLSFWTEQDILQYIKDNKLPICSVYGDVVYTDGENFYDDCLNGDMQLTTTGYKRTGCVFCGFGAHLENVPNRFQSLEQTHPKQFEFCMRGGAYGDDGIWRPNKDGLGMSHVIDELNKIYGDDFIAQ